MTRLTDLDLTINGTSYFAMVRYTPIGHVEDATTRGVYFGTPYTHTEHEFIVTDVEIEELQLFLNDDDGTPVLDPALIEMATVIAKKELIHV